MICIDYSPIFFFAGNMQIDHEQAPLMDSCGQPIYVVGGQMT